jgi:hypothetical protein
MRRFGDIALLGVQWALVLQGLALILIALQGYSFDGVVLQSQSAPLPGQDMYRIPIYHRLVQGTTMGTIALGLGALLFFLLRLLHLRRK